MYIQRKVKDSGGDSFVKKTLSTLMEAVLLLFLIACGTKDAWQEQYDLGMHYLNGGNY